MEIRAKELKESGTPGKTELYVVRSSRDIVVEEEQDDGSLDQVKLVYCMEGKGVGYFAKEYRPANVGKTGSKVIDITAAIVDHAEKNVRWHLYDIKDTLAGENTVIKLYAQWNSGLKYLQENILDHTKNYSATPHLGVITRKYDEERMKRLRDDSRKRCEEMDNNQNGVPLALQKKRSDIAKLRGTFRASSAILDREFQPENGSDTYEILIIYLLSENERVYNVTVIV